MTYTPAPVYRRALALIYDTLLIIAILFLATFLALWLRDGEGFGANHLGFTLYLLMWAGSYVTFCWHRGGQTLGMKAWKIKIQTIHGQPLSWSQALLRFGTGIAGFWTVLGFLWCLIDKNKQSLADNFCDTAILRCD